MTMLLILLILSALVLAGAYYAYHVAFHAPKKGRPTADDPMTGPQYEAVADHLFRMTNVIRSIPFEPITVKSHDGLTLFGRYYHVKDGAPVEILFHGYRSCAFRDCSGGHALSRKMGFNSIVVDQRAHGESGGNTITFGIRERFDCLRWAEYARDRFGAETPIILSGLSMGAATVLMASGLSLPENVVCIMADSPFSSPISIIEKVCRDMHYPVALCRPFRHLGARLFGKFRLNECEATQAVRRAAASILLLHGEADDFVPCPMSTEIAACCASPVTVHTFPEAGHGLSYVVDPLRYERSVYDFLCKIPKVRDKISEDFVRQLSE